MIPYVEGEGSAAIGIIAGIHPLLAAVAGIAGNLLSVILVVLANYALIGICDSVGRGLFPR